MARNKPIYRKKPEEFLFRRKLRYFTLKISKILQILIVLSLISFCVWSIWFDNENKLNEFFSSKTKNILINAGFAIKTIEIVGNNEVSNNTIIEAMLKNELEDISNYPITMLSLKQVKENLQGIKWIEDISLKKQLPSKVEIHITERKPKILWQSNGEVWLADREGILITKNVKEYLHLPIIVGRNSEEDIINILTIINKSELLESKIESAERIGNRRWNIKLNNNITVMLPEKDAVTAWLSLESFEKSKKILSKNIDYIDLRIEGQLVAGLGDNRLSDSYSF